MKRRTVFAVLSALLLMGMATSAFNIQPVGASGTIYIRPDGTVEGTDKIQRDGDVYTFTDNIYDRIVVEIDNVVVDGAGYTLQGPGYGNGTDLIHRSNVTITNTEIKSFFSGIMLISSSNNTISGNNITNNECGIYLDYSSNNTISGNNITNNWIGIHLYGDCNTVFGNNIRNSEWGIYFYASSDNTLFGNTITNSYMGMRLYESSTNTFYHNNFVDNTFQVYSYSSTNVWDDGYPSGGNYWSDYAGKDLFRGVNQNFAGSDGMGDTPYIIDADNEDRYPLMKAWTPVLISIQPICIIDVPIGETFTISVDIFNVRNLYGWQLNLTFDPGIVSVTEVTEGPFLKQVDRTIFTKKIDNALGYTVVAAQFMPPYPPDGAYGNGTIANVTFEVISVGQTLLEFNKPMTKLISLILGHLLVHIEHETRDSCFSNLVISCDVSIDANTLNLRSKGKWITAYIQLPEGYNPEDIDPTAILLNGTISPVLDPKYDFVTNSSEYIVDYNGDGILERMVKFDRTMVSEYILSKSITNGYATLSVTGEVNGTPFEGTDTIRILMSGGGTRGHK